MDVISEFVFNQAGERGESHQRRLVSGLSLNANQTLHKAENAWRPLFGKLARDLGATEEEQKTQEVLRELRAILNKLTPENFDSLMKRLSQLEINTEARLKATIGLIFDKAVSEQSYCPAYARMCHHLLGLNVATEDGHCVTFRKVLLRHCQSQFEKNQNEEEMMNIQEKLDAAENVADCQQLKLKLEQVHFHSRRRSLGNMKLIGELFKLQMLTTNIIHSCVVKLLKDEDEESLECLCKLMSTIGKELDTPKDKPDMDQYFAHINKIIQRKTTSTRIRFMLQAVIDLRKNNWVPRRAEEGPKVIREIHVEAHLGVPGQGKGGLMTGKERSRCQGTTKPGFKPSAVEQEPCSKDRRGDQSEHSDLTPADGGQSHRSKDHMEKSGPIGESSRVEDCRLRRGGGRDHLERPDRLSGSQNWHLTRKNKSSDQESSRYNNWRRSSDHERGHPHPFGNFSKSQKWHDTSTFKGSGQKISRFKNWGFKVDHDRHPLNQTGQLCNWRVPSNNGRSTQESSWCNSWRFQGDHGRDQQDRSEHLSSSRDTRANRRSGPPNARSNSEWCNHQSKPSHRSNRQRMNNALQRVEDTSNLENWHAVNARKQFVLDSEKWRIRPDRYRSDCKPETFPSREDQDRHQCGRSGVKATGDAREVIQKRLLAKDLKKDMEKVTLENNRTKDLARLLQGGASNQQLSSWIQANLSNQEVSSAQFVRGLVTSVCVSAIDVRGVHQLNRSRILQRSEILKNFLNNGQKQREALKALQKLTEQTRLSNNVMRLLIDILFDEGIIGKDVFCIGDPSAEPSGADASRRSVTSFFTRLQQVETEGSGSAFSQSRRYVKARKKRNGGVSLTVEVVESCSRAAADLQQL